MTETERKQAAIAFAKKWKDRGDEKSDTQSFWIELLTSIYGASGDSIKFEKRVKIDGTTKFIDGYIPDTKVLIEQKSIDVDLDHAGNQSDKISLTPFKQAERYAEKLNYDETPRWIVTSNFREIRVYDRNKRHEKPEVILLKDLPKEYYRLQFLVNAEDETAKKRTGSQHTGRSNRRRSIRCASRTICG